MSKPTPAEFRQKLIADLVYSTRWPRQVALHGGEEGLAKELGVQEDVLQEAISLARAGFRTDPDRVKPGTKPSGLVPFRMHYPAELLILATNLALEMGRAQGSLLRDMLHAAMQSTTEPTKQPRLRYRKIMLRGKLLSGKFTYAFVMISPALKEAVSRRAIAFGETMHAYVRCWLVDLVEGRLGHLDLQHVRLGQMFDSVDAYVLPALTVPP